MNTDEFPIANVRIVKALVADAPANFVDLAVAADLPYIEEPAEWGTRFVVDFADVPAAAQDHPLIRQLAALDKSQDDFDQLWLETR